MLTKTLIEAIGEVGGETRSQVIDKLMSIEEIYSTPFNLGNVKKIFEAVNPAVKWMDKGVIQVDKLTFSPRTIADFVSLMSCLKFKLTPRSDGDGRYSEAMLNQ